MTIIDENMAEQATLDWFEDLGYERVFGPDIARIDTCCLMGNNRCRYGNK